MHMFFLGHNDLWESDIHNIHCRSYLNALLGRYLGGEIWERKMQFDV